MAIGNLLANGPEGGRPELVSLSTLVFVCSYPCAAATVILALRGRSGPPGIGALLDAIVGTLAVAALLMAFVLPPALAATRHDPVGLMLVLVFPVLDLAMAALGLSVLAMSTARSEQLSGWLGLGMVTFAVADWQLAVGMARGTWEGGHPIDAAWVIGSAAVGLGAVSRRLPAARADDPRRPTGFAVTIGAAAVALAVMVAGTETTMPRAGVLLAAACVLAALLRMLVAHGQMRSLAQVSQWARTDELTGLSNRRVLNEALARLQRSGARDPALLLADLDRFKQVNDHFGHEVGDRVLAEVAEQFRRVVPAGSLLARLGGDEFAVLVLEPGEALQIARSLVDAVSRVRVPGELTIGVSVGVVDVATRPWSTPGELLRRADLAMYLAKGDGCGVHEYVTTDEHGAPAGPHHDTSAPVARRRRTTA
ncbi:MAG: GGDEF domain-containing protein [Kineosporiaceae bacterium]|nr:GGDEF domain-containing protein [Kineosporiaceae bacterium]